MRYLAISGTKCEEGYDLRGVAPELRCETHMRVTHLRTSASNQFLLNISVSVRASRNEIG